MISLLWQAQGKTANRKVDFLLIIIFNKFCLKQIQPYDLVFRPVPASQTEA